MESTQQRGQRRALWLSDGPAGHWHLGREGERGGERGREGEGERGRREGGGRGRREGEEGGGREGGGVGKTM